MIGTCSDSDHLNVWLTSYKLISTIKNFENRLSIFNIDATYKLSKNRFPLIVFGNWICLVFTIGQLLRLWMLQVPPTLTERFTRLRTWWQVTRPQTITSTSTNHCMLCVVAWVSISTLHNAGLLTLNTTLLYTFFRMFAYLCAGSI